MLGGARIRLDTRDAGRGAAEISERGREQADAPVEVEVPGIRIDPAVAAWCMCERGRDERTEGLGGQSMDLPEAARVDPEGAVADPLEDDFTGGAVSAGPGRWCRSPRRGR